MPTLCGCCSRRSVAWLSANQRALARQAASPSSWTARRQTVRTAATSADSISTQQTSSLPPPNPPVDYHFPFGNPSLLIATLPSRKHADYDSPASCAPAPTSRPIQPSTKAAAATATPPRPLLSALHPPSTPLSSPLVDRTAAAAAAAAAGRGQGQFSGSHTVRMAEADPLPLAHAHTQRQGGGYHHAPASSRHPMRELEVQEPDSRQDPGTLGIAGTPRMPGGRGGRPDLTLETQNSSEAAADEEALFGATEAEQALTLDPVYVLGTDPRATYLAHMLSGLPHSPPVRLLLSGQAMTNWLEEGRRVRLLRAGALQPRGRVMAELLAEPTDAALLAAAVDVAPSAHRKTKPRYRHIENLVVTLPCARSINAIRWLRHRIDHRTTICLVQPGLGVAERLNELYFADIATRPRYVLGYMTHDLGYHDRNFTLTELAPGNMRLTAYDPTGPVSAAGAAAGESAADESAAADLSGGDGGDGDDGGLQLVRLLGLTPTLGAGGYAVDDFLRWKLPEMVYTAAVEPIATVLDMAPDAVWQNGEARALVEGLMQEMVAVTARLPETQASPTLTRFVRSGMLARQAQRRRQQKGGQHQQQQQQQQHQQYQQHQPYQQHQHDNGSPAQHHRQQRARSWKATMQSAGDCRMAKLVREGRVTDIQFLNGWFVRRGREVGVACPQNEMVMRLVRAKQMAGRVRMDDYIPMVEEGAAAAAAQPMSLRPARQHVRAGGWPNPQKPARLPGGGNDGVDRRQRLSLEDDLEEDYDAEDLRIGPAESIGGYC